MTSRQTRTLLAAAAVLTLGLSPQMVSGQQTPPTQEVTPPTAPTPSQEVTPPVVPSPGQVVTPPAAPTPSQEAAPLVELVNEYVERGVGPRDFAVTLRIDFFKGALLQGYAPYTVSLDSADLNAASVMFYLRIVERRIEPAQAEGITIALTEPPPSPPVAPAAPAVVFEDLLFADVPTPGSGEPMRISRAFALDPGDYDVYIALQERGTTEGAQTSVLQQPITVPDFFAETLSTSSVMQIERMGVRPAPLTATALLERPYTLGTMEIVPAWRSTYTTSDTLSLLFIIYSPSNAADTNRPNVTVDYDFYRTSDGSETFFNSTPRMTFNAQTLPVGFDLALGHQLVAERSVPLQAFPAGDYRIDITVFDRVSGRSLGRQVSFSVEAP